MSARAEFKGDFMGFTYNEKHSSELGIVRTSDGSRFNENLLPTMQDKTVQVPGGDGTYFFGSYYTQRQFSVSFAFDSLTEEQVAMLRAHFGDKGIHDLIFDERPYKVYRAKVSGNATIKYIVFDEGNTHRRYKGEGTIQFTCYEPFARCRAKSKEFYSSIPEYSQLTDSQKSERINEWWDASGLGNINVGNEIINVEDSTQPTSEASLFLYNPGDCDCNFMLRIPFGDDGHSIPAGQIKIGSNFLSWDLISERKINGVYVGDDGVFIDSKTNLIVGYENTGTDDEPFFLKTGNIYNDYLTDGSFFKIPCNASELTLIGNFSEWTSLNLYYDYLYI